MFGAEAAAFGEIHKGMILPDGTDSSIYDFMRMDLYEDQNFMNALNLVVPEGERSALETMFKAPKFTDEGGIVVPRKKAVESIRPYINKFVNERVKSATNGKYEEGQDPMSTEKYILENFGYRTQLDDNDFVGSDMSNFEEGFFRMLEGFRPIADQMLVGGANILGFLAGDADVDNFVRQFATNVNEDQKKRREAFESEMPLRFTYDREAEDIGQDIEKYTVLNMTSEEMVQTAESAPVTLTSLVGAFAAGAGTMAASKNPAAAYNAAAFAQATIMGLAVNGQEYMSTFDDPNFYDYFDGDQPYLLKKLLRLMNLETWWLKMVIAESTIK